MLLNKIEIYDDCIYVDDEYIMNLTLLDKTTRAPIDITGYTARMQLREQILGTDVPVDLSYLIDATDGPLGFVTFSIVPTLTTSLVPDGSQTRKYYYDVRITSPASETTTILRGRFTARQSALT